MRNYRVWLNCLLLVTVAIIGMGVFRKVAVSGGDADALTASRGGNPLGSGSLEGSSRRTPRGKPPAQRAASLADVNLGFFDKRADYSTVETRGMVGISGLELLGIDTSKRPAIQAILDEGWGKAETDMKKRMYLVEGESDPSKGVFVYRIPAARESGEAILAEVAGNLSNLIGEKETVRFLAGMNPFAKRAGFGMGEVRIQIESEPGKPKFMAGRWTDQVDLLVRHPETGKQVFRSTGMAYSVLDDPIGISLDELLPKCLGSVPAS